MKITYLCITKINYELFKIMKEKTKRQIENCLVSKLRNMVWELQSGTLTEELLYNYFKDFMCDAKVDSEITVNVLEQFGELGKDEARNIKVYEGW